MSEHSERESMEFGVVIVGGGPSGRAATCCLSQLAEADSKHSKQNIVRVVPERGRGSN